MLDVIIVLVLLLSLAIPATTGELKRHNFVAAKNLSVAASTDLQIQTGMT